LLSEIATGWGDGCAVIRFENYPVSYEETIFEVDFHIKLDDPVTSQMSIDQYCVELNKLNLDYTPDGFELWVKESVVRAWN
jgi:hypothetical protein